MRFISSLFQMDGDGNLALLLASISLNKRGLTCMFDMHVGLLSRQDQELNIFCVISKASKLKPFWLL